MTVPRATALTQYELTDLNDGRPVPRRTWLRCWASVSEPVHPHSQQEWDAILEAHDLD